MTDFKRCEHCGSAWPRRDIDLYTGCGPCCHQSRKEAEYKVPRKRRTNDIEDGTPEAERHAAPSAPGQLKLF